MMSSITGNICGFYASLLDSGEILSCKHMILCNTIALKIWRHFDLTSIKSQVDEVIVSDDHYYRYLRAKWPRKHVSQGMIVTYFLVTFCDLI